MELISLNPINHHPLHLYCFERQLKIIGKSLTTDLASESLYPEQIPNSSKGGKKNSKEICLFV